MARYGVAYSCLTLLLQIPLFAASSVTLAWDASPDASVTGYRIYYGPATASYTNSVPVGNVTNATVTNLVAGATYFFAATASDASGLESDFSNETTYTVPSASTNQPPTLNAIAGVTVNEDVGVQVVNLSGISSGSVNETQTLTVTASSSNPGLIPNPTVSYNSPNATGSLSFTPTANANGNATITVTVNDGQAANNTVVRTFAITVNAVNDLPGLATISNVTVNEDATAQTVSLTGIGSGAANENQTLTITATSSDPSLIPNPTVSYASPNATGSLNLAPTANASGVATITVTVNDGQAVNNTASRTFTVTVNPVNDSPTLAALNPLNLTENAGQQNVTLTGIGTGAGNETQTLTVTATSSNPSLVPSPTVNYTSPNATGSVSFTPAANANGSATITVTVNDGQSVNNTVTRTFAVNVSAVNNPPTLAGINGVTVDEDAAAQVVTLTGVSAGATNELQTLSVTATSSNPGLIPNPTVNYTSPNATGSLNFTPGVNANGTAVITVTVNDGQSLNNTVSQTFTVTVNAVNDAPTLNAVGNLNVAENATQQTVILGGISAGAANETQALIITATSSDVSVVPNPTVSYTSPNATGTLGFTPVANANGTATITVTVNDGQAVNNTTTRSFTVNVSAVNTAPTLAALGNVTITEDDGAQTVNLTGVGTGAANELQTLTITASSSNPGLIPNPSVSYISPNAAGTLSFAPRANSNGTSVITVTVNDGQALNNTVSQTFTVTVNAVNDAPTLDAVGNLNVAENALQQTVNLSGISAGAANETQALSITATSSDASVIPNPTVSYTSPNATGTLGFTPVANANGTVTITVTVNDGQAVNNTTTRSFVVNVSTVNNQPTLAALNNVTISEDASAQTVNLGGIGTGAANETDTLTITATSSNPSLIANPTVSYASPNATGSLSFIPVANSNGTAIITVTVNDGQTLNNTVSRNFTVTVNAVNDPPTLSPLNGLTINEDAPAQTVNLSGIGTGAANEIQALNITAISSDPSLIPNPTLNYTSPNAAGSLSFTPVANANGTATITVTVNDGQAANNTVTQSFTVTVNPANDAPTLNALTTMTLAENAGVQTVSLSGIGAGAPNESQTLTVTAASSNAGLIPNPSVNYSSPNATGSLNFTPVANSNGTATITVTVNDSQAANNTVTRTFVVTVTSVNSAPTISAIPSQTVVSGAGSGPISFTIADIETAAAALTLTASSTAPAILPAANIVFGGSGGNRTVTLTPAANQSGTATVTLTVSDGSASASTTFLVTVQVQTSQLSVNKSGSGTVTPDLGNSPLVVGQSYTLTATPATGYVFSGWTGGIQSSSPTLTFTMTVGLVLQANFTASPHVATAGTYNGLFNEADEVRLNSAGAFNVYADANGNYSGWVQIGYSRHTISGQLQLDSKATNVVTRWNGNPLTVELRLGQNSEVGQIFGRITDGVWTSTLSGGRAVYQTAGEAPQAGEYTVVFPGQVGDPSLPAGDGYGTLHLGTDGLGTLSGTLADGTSFSQTAWLTAEGDWPLYVSLYAGKGAVISWLTFTNQVSSDINGAVVWIKQANPAAAQYPAGFISDTKAVGSLYVAPTGGGKAINLSSASVSFLGGSLPADFSNAVSVNAGSSVVNLSPNPLTLTISPALGSFTGQVAEPGTGVVHPFSGVVLQKQNAGFGFLQGSTQSSRVVLAAP